MMTDNEVTAVIQCEEYFSLISLPTGLLRTAGQAETRTVNKSFLSKIKTKMHKAYMELPLVGQLVKNNFHHTANGIF